MAKAELNAEMLRQTRSREKDHPQLISKVADTLLHKANVIDVAEVLALKETN